MGSVYRVELWWRNQSYIGDIRRMCSNLRWTKTRNGMDTVDFLLNVDRFERWCADRGEHPRNVLSHLNTDIRIKVRDTYVTGTVLVERPGNFNQSNATMEVSGDGFLSLLHARRYTGDFNNYWTGGIIRDTLLDLQSEPNGDMGITFDPTSYLGNAGTRQYQYLDQDVGDMLVNRSRYVTDPYDFEFRADRTLKLWAKLGNDRRDDTVISYPGGRDGTIQAYSARFRSTGQDVANRITAIGAGSGKAAIRATADDEASQAQFGIKEHVVLMSDISVESTLQQHADVELAMRKAVLEQPRPSLTGAELPTDEYSVGDIVTFQHTRFDSFRYNQAMRIEEMEVSVDDNDAESIILTLDAATV